MHRSELTVASRGLASLLLAVALLASPAAGLAADADADSSSTAVHGKGARRTARFDRLIALFRADRLAVYQQFGFPDYRYYELTFNTRTERWIYLAEDLEFVFAGDRLLSRE